jgi:aminocarboxymuconate-semialdehyde decarboxylase
MYIYAEQIYLDCIAHDRQALRFAVETFGADRIVVGSDMPFDIGETAPASEIQSLGIADRDQCAILSGNTQHLFGISSS